MSSLFFLTLLICCAIFLFSRNSLFISPLAHIFASKNEDYIGEVKTYCQETHLNCIRVEQTDNTTIQAVLDIGVTAYLSTKKDLKNQVASLQQAISQLTIKGKMVKTIDFRFDHVVVSL